IAHAARDEGPPRTLITRFKLMDVDVHWLYVGRMHNRSIKATEEPLVVRLTKPAKCVAIACSQSRPRAHAHAHSELLDLLDLTVTAMAAASSSGLVKRIIPISFISLLRGSTITFLIRSPAMPRRLKLAGSHCFSLASSAGPILSNSARI